MGRYKPPTLVIDGILYGTFRDTQGMITGRRMLGYMMAVYELPETDMFQSEMNPR